MLSSYIRLQWLVFGFFIFSQSLWAQGGVFDLDCKHLAPIEQSYLRRHINHTKPTKNLEHRTVDQFIKRMDPSKIYLLSSDINQIKKMMNGVFKQTRARNCQSIEKAYDIYKKRVDERVNYARAYLGGKFKFNPRTELILDPDERKYPKNVKASNQFQRKYLQFQVGNYLASDMKLAEAKEHVIRNYERLQRRVKGFKKTDLWSLYLDSFARSLDPHSSYLSRENLEDFQIQMRLSLEGIGATLSSKDGFTVIEQLIPGGAAYRSGQLKTKDKIIAVGQGGKSKPENVIEMDLRDVVAKIRGKKGTKVVLTVLRKDGKETKRFTVGLVRDKIKLEDDAASITYMDREVNGVKKKIGLLNLPSFYADHRKKGRSSASDLKKLLKEANKKKVDAVVLDLSTNGGGSLEDAVKTAGLFFRKGNVVKQSHRDPTRQELELADDDPKVDYAGPLVLLVSRISASASEIVAGTLQDYGRAVIVGGDHTFGKGSVQSVEPLPPGLGALKTTVGMFFVPGGNSTQHRGVSSDIVFPSAYSTKEIGEKNLDYSLPPKKVKSFLSPEAFVEKGVSAWRVVSKSVISSLRKKSEARVKKNKDFNEIIENMAKAEKKGKIIKISEILKEKEKEEAEAKKEEAESSTSQLAQTKKGKSKSKKEDDNGKLNAKNKDSWIESREDKKKKYLKRADIQEAINIAADLIGEYSTTSITVGAKGRLKEARRVHRKKNSANN